MKKNVLVLDGLLIPANKRFLDSFSPGMLIGRGAFETMRSYHGTIFMLDEHLKRLKKGLKSLSVKSPYTSKKIKEYIESSLRSNNIKDARVRVTVWRQDRNIRCAIVALPYKPITQKKYARGYSVMISDVRRDERSKFSKIKSINYLPFLNAYHQAAQKGYDEAILLNRQGHCVEASRSNLFLVKDSKLYTPALHSGCLNGITRQAVIGIARQMGIKVISGSIKTSDIKKADEAFLTNSLIEIMPLTNFEGRPMGNSKIGPMTDDLLKRYRRLVQKHIGSF